MVETGALTPGKDDKSFDINFAVVANQFPDHLEFMVCYSLTEFEREVYLQGYMVYKVRSDGMLEWHVTYKRL